MFFLHDIRYDIGFMDPDICPNIIYDIGYDILVDVVNISYPISDMISFPITSLHYHDRYRCTAGAPESRPSYRPHESDDCISDIEMNADDMPMICAIVWTKIDCLDQDVPPTSAGNLGPYARCLADLPDWSDSSKEKGPARTYGRHVLGLLSALCVSRV